MFTLKRSSSKAQLFPASHSRPRIVAGVIVDQQDIDFVVDAIDFDVVGHPAGGTQIGDQCQHADFANAALELYCSMEQFLLAVSSHYYCLILCYVRIPSYKSSA